MFFCQLCYETFLHIIPLLFIAQITSVFLTKASKIESQEAFRSHVSILEAKMSVLFYASTVRIHHWWRRGGTHKLAWREIVMSRYTMLTGSMKLSRLSEAQKLNLGTWRFIHGAQRTQWLRSIFVPAVCPSFCSTAAHSLVRPYYGLRFCSFTSIHATWSLFVFLIVFIRTFWLDDECLYIYLHLDPTSSAFEFAWASLCTHVLLQ